MNTTTITFQDRLDDMTPLEYRALAALHALMREVKESPRSDKYDPVQFIRDIEFTMQGIWGFTRDASYHSHWLDIKGCKCPRSDNLELIPSGKRLINKSCPWHGKKEETQ